VKFRLSKPGDTAVAPDRVVTCGPICHGALSESGDVVLCDGHRFARNRVELIDFTTLAPEITAGANAAKGAPDAVMLRLRRSNWSRRGRRFVLLILSTGYVGFLLLLMPLGMIVGIFNQPFRRQSLLSPGHSSA